VLISPEGLDQTVKLPSAGDAFLRPGQASIDSDSTARAAYPDVMALMRRVLGRAPLTVRVDVAEGRADIVVGAFEIQRMAADRMGDPPGASAVLAAFAAADGGDWSVHGAWAQRRTREPIFLAPMPLATDAASGVSPAKRRIVKREAAATVLGDALGWPVLHAGNELADLDLGESFRSPFRSHHDVLILSGTLDGRTYSEEHREVAEMFNRVTVLTLVNGGHSAGIDAPEARRRLIQFLRGEVISTEPILLATPRWIR
jgi:hypothetical protein